ncbi:PQ loop repeat-domain-containing protein [Fimicolochytrium jonesii]|uniref:PQ loop repeat-domain-containing protein n=1 Tax=Fimicolochytrium jonesii TaxID=1396493 RepID=UPI0022FDD0B4|nr:PQ loop repeat-domain-containing protein [Fimicolochytrium jonesii]KAI8820689.1 PQ loop repeat-domain-containing protein [Fimicolochytrium jonesii]
MSAWLAVSPIVGWGYFVAWSVSFYPQVILNYKRKSVEGLSLDFVSLNLWGFLCYSLYNIGLYVNRKGWGIENSVHLNDVVFALHALTLTGLTAVQTVLYTRARGQRVSSATKLFITVTSACVLLAGGLAATGAIPILRLLYLLSYVKMAVSLIKYIPQAFLNRTRQSTEGWSIVNILLDLTGGTLSLLQIFADSAVTGDWSAITRNPVKFGLGLVSIGFDFIFVLQHYVLYRHKPAKDILPTFVKSEERRETDPLLPRSIPV